jgi:hypothetical protein
MLVTHQKKKNCRRMSAEPDGFNQGVLATMGHQTPAAKNPQTAIAQE